MKRLSGANRRLVLEVSLGNLVFNMILTVLALIFYPKPSVLTGLIAGMIMVTVMLVSIARSLEKAMELGEAAAVRKSVSLSALRRKLVFAAAFLLMIVFLSEQINPLAVIAGCFGLKAGIYMKSAAAGLRARHRRMAQ